MIRKIEKFAHDLKVEYGIRADRALSTLREATIDTAELIKSSKSPIRKFADTGLKLNRITSRSVDRLVRNQVHLVEGTLDDGARRLKMAARANTVRDLIGDQIASLPASRERTIGSARKSIDIIKLTGKDLRGVVTEVIGDIRDSASVTVVRKTGSSVDKRTRKAVSNVERKTRKAASDLEAKTLKTIADVEGKDRKAVDVVEKETRSVARKAAAKKRKPVRKAVRKSTVRSAVAKTSAKTRTKVASRKAVAVKAVRKTANKRKVVARKVAQKTSTARKAA